MKSLFLTAVAGLVLESSPVSGQSSTEYQAAIREEIEAYFRDCVEHAYFGQCKRPYIPPEMASVLDSGNTSFQAGPLTLSVHTEKALSFESVSLLSDTSNRSTVS
jgi:hypothetical protein